MDGTPPHRVALVTGATGGLGPAVVRTFLDDGAAVVATYRDPAGAERVRRDLGASIERVVFEQADLTNRDDVDRLVAATVTRWGRLDYLVNVAGAWAGGQPVRETGDDELERMLSANLRGAFVCCRAVVPQMLKQRFGRIVNVGSRTAMRAEAGTVAYGIAKAGVVRLTEVLALDLRRASDAGGVGEHDVTANCILPSVIDTPENRKAMPKGDVGAWVRPEQVAAVIRWLTSAEAAPVSGAAIPVYGRA